MAVNGIPSLSGFANKLFLASRKNNYPMYWQGDNLSDGYTTVNSANDFFARQGYLIRLPRVVRIFTTHAGDAAEMAYFRAYGAHAATEFAEDKICVTYGDVVDDVSFRRWLQAAIPDPGTAVDAHQGGEVLVLIFNQRSSGYGSLYPPASIHADFQTDYSDYLSKYGRFARIKVVFYQRVPSDGSLVFQDLTNDQIKGLGVYAGAGTALTSLGWEYHQVDFTAPTPNYDTLDTLVRDFFGV